MPRTLMLLRHAKSSWQEPALPDFERPLAPRGRAAAQAMGQVLAERSWQPDLVLCSPAARTRETWALLAPALGTVPPCRQLPSLYLATPAQLWRVLRRAPDEVERLLVIGHNPGLEEFAAALIGSGDAALRKLLARKFPTAALAVLTLADATWAAATPGSGCLSAFLRPKDLPSRKRKI